MWLRVRFLTTICVIFLQHDARGVVLIGCNEDMYERDRWILWYMNL